MRCRKLGHVFVPDKLQPWMWSHASNPVAVRLSDDVQRVYFSSRDQNKRSHVCFLDMNVKNRAIEAICTKPVIEPGEAGFFDDSGASVGCIVANPTDSKHYLYYLGWNLAPNVPFRNSIGLAISNGSIENFAKYCSGPIIDRSTLDPLTVSYPWVIQDGDKWKMWYGSHESWATGDCEMIHVLKYAESSDGKNWHPLGKVDLAFDDEGEFALSRPCVLKEQGKYKMWFSYRGKKQYRIGYAESEDGIRWQRLGCCLSPSESGWDSQSVEYASVFDTPSGRFMLYCGNGYGETGFGIAAVDS